MARTVLRHSNVRRLGNSFLPSERLLLYHDPNGSPVPDGSNSSSLQKGMGLFYVDKRFFQTLTLSNSARRDKTVGEIVNLMAIDVERFQTITPQIQQFWSCPYQIILALIYLYFTLGYSAVAGIIIMIVFLPMNIISSFIVKNWQVRFFLEQEAKVFLGRTNQAKGRENKNDE